MIYVGDLNMLREYLKYLENTLGYLENILKDPHIEKIKENKLFKSF